ncbi:uncharacterized protein LOC109856746 isoform X2 [Pseudomyrmex gracilis]|uniref:uncharacterized protein LOC109856746 isoform X2 n=1 Tax=Pseudomyrmex gracilis TaxID=219809 RepID=UPI000994A1C7|nr:uncharacterized protein LOC109856746 isoform X2 [Pseudomyrmex gracilis]
MASEREIQMEHYTSNISVDILVQPQIGGGWNGPIKLIVSCVTDDPPHKCHPFIIVGQSRRCGYGIYTEYLMNGDEFVVLSGIGLKILEEKQFAWSLKMRRDLRASPFETDSNPLPLEDYSKLRLCFHAYVKTPRDLLFDIPVKPVLSKSINLLIIDPITSSLQPVSPIIIRSYQEDNSGAASSSAGTSASATRRESRWEWLAKLSSPAARDDTAIASGSSQNLSERTPTKARDSPKKFNLHFYYHKKDRGGSSDSDSD